MIITSFDAAIMLNDHHLAMVALSTRKADAVAAVWTAIERMDGAGWVVVEAQSHSPELEDWVTLSPRGRSDMPDRPEWRALRQKVEEIALAALRAVGAGC
jgi:hypothetical protein